jgi:hypothetical protein
MFKLINILKGMLLELADTSKHFSIRKTGNNIKKQPGYEYIEGSKYYKFITDNNIEYEVSIGYLSEDDEEFYTGEKEGQMVEVIFYIDADLDSLRNPETARNQFDTTNNPKELFKVMNTVIECIKEAREETYFKYVIYHPSDVKGGVKNPKGNEQRKKLYDYYFNKIFPGVDIENKGKFTIYTLP